MWFQHGSGLEGYPLHVIEGIRNSWYKERNLQENPKAKRHEDVELIVDNPHHIPYLVGKV